MKYERFEDLPVWQLAADLAAKILPWPGHQSLRGMGDLSNQLQRATLSISNNIAEGFERGSTAELLQFLYYARGSAGEVRSVLCIMERIELLSDLSDELEQFRSDSESVSRQLRGWANSLQNSDIKGQRHLNDASREQYERQQRQMNLLERQREYVRQKEQELKQAAALRYEEKMAREKADDEI
jgi:four helix bundle protein